MPSVPSSADREEAAVYMQGECHVFAIALHRMTGWPIHLILDQDERYWEDPDDIDNWIPAVVHAYCVDPSGNAWDVLGCRPLHDARAELEAWIRIGSYDSDRVFSEEELSVYVGCWAPNGEEPVDRPLVAYGEEDVVAALKTAARVLEGVPGFGGGGPFP